MNRKLSSVIVILVIVGLCPVFAAEQKQGDLERLSVDQLSKMVVDKVYKEGTKGETRDLPGSSFVGFCLWNDRINGIGYGYDIQFEPKDETKLIVIRGKEKTIYEVIVAEQTLLTKREYGNVPVLMIGCYLTDSDNLHIFQEQGGNAIYRYLFESYLSWESNDFKFSVLSRTRFVDFFSKREEAPYCPFGYYFSGEKQKEFVWAGGITTGSNTAEIMNGSIKVVNHMPDRERATAQKLLDVQKLYKKCLISILSEK